MTPAQSDPQQRKTIFIGPAKGLAQGQAKGLAKGLAKVFAKVLAKGIAKGIAQGLAKGLAKGEAKGLVERLWWSTQLRGCQMLHLHKIIRATCCLHEDRTQTKPLFSTNHSTCGLTGANTMVALVQLRQK